MGQRYMCNKVAQQLALRAFEEAPGCPFEQLSSREMQIALMIANCQRVNEISAQLHLSPKTVNSYRYRIFEKARGGQRCGAGVVRGTQGHDPQRG
jgi:DNA-binding NarL/FixJ family response regulator